MEEEAVGFGGGEVGVGDGGGCGCDGVQQKMALHFVLTADRAFVDSGRMNY